MVRQENAIYFKIVVDLAEIDCYIAIVETDGNGTNVANLSPKLLEQTKTGEFQQPYTRQRKLTGFKVLDGESECSSSLLQFAALQ